MKSICIIGNGRMGNAIKEILSDQYKSYQYSRLTKENLDDFLKNLRISDGVIDASHPDNIESALEDCLTHKKPYLCCTTGLRESHFEHLKKAGKEIPVLYAANTSLGIAILKKAAALVSKVLGNEADIKIFEKHHALKKDAPSGTALELGKTIAQTGYLETSIQYESVREGDIIGEHMVQFTFEDEIIQLNHECLNRNVFAKGALKAAHWLFKQPPGFYTLNDVLGM
ncbi:MAG: 4-hydroxy-tetrahydrodipicolinate reductase [Pseudomonadota bacterium]